MERDVWRSTLWGIVLIVAGVIFLLASYGILPVTISKLSPWVLIIFGLACIVKKRQQKS